MLESLIHNLELPFTSQEILTIFEELYNQFLSIIEQKSISINELDEQPLHEFQELEEFCSGIDRIKDSNFFDPQYLFHSLTQLKESKGDLAMTITFNACIQYRGKMYLLMMSYFLLRNDIQEAMNIVHQFVEDLKLFVAVREKLKSENNRTASTLCILSFDCKKLSMLLCLAFIGGLIIFGIGVLVLLVYYPIQLKELIQPGANKQHSQSMA